MFNQYSELFIYAYIYMRNFCCVDVCVFVSFSPALNCLPLLVFYIIFLLSLSFTLPLPRSSTPLEAGIMLRLEELTSFDHIKDTVSVSCRSNVSVLVKNVMSKRVQFEAEGQARQYCCA